MLNNHNEILNNLYVSVIEVNNKKCIVSGSRGYVGSNLIKGFSLVDKGYLSQITLDGADLFIHLAAQVNDDFNSFLNNLVIDSFVFNFCSKKKLKLVYASGNNIYPFKEDCDETCEYRNNDYYSLSKICGETLLFSESLESLEFVIFRIGDVFGYNQKHGNFFKALEKSIIENSPLNLYGEGRKTRNYIYIKELSNIIKFFVENYKYINNKAYNICFTEAYSLNQIVEKISAILGLSINKIDYPDKPDVRTMKNNELKNLGYDFLYSMESGLEDYVREIKRY